ncbi:2-dehydropantoate 2-reductase [Striga asiatica]|uniref:2-dehydropantoate 2-reductase n=1 Tax=Striga asiatica TaxID=4170 RepID=A0A5A7PS48_STRAF|nr:2-dehydropantoate 2-reductase [Striga asiatica]
MAVMQAEKKAWAEKEAALAVLWDRSKLSTLTLGFNYMDILDLFPDEFAREFDMLTTYNLFWMIQRLSHKLLSLKDFREILHRKIAKLGVDNKLHPYRVVLGTEELKAIVLSDGDGGMAGSSKAGKTRFVSEANDPTNGEQEIRTEGATRTDLNAHAEDVTRRPLFELLQISIN